MAGIIGNFVFAYGFVTDISNKRYFEGATINSDMETVKAKKRWRRFLNEVGWYHSFFGIGIEEQTKLYVFGERILSGEDDTLIYLDYAYTGPDEVIIHDIQEDIFDAKLTYRDIIDHEAALNGTTPRFLLFMNDKDYAAMEVYGGMPPRPDHALNTTDEHAARCDMCGTELQEGDETYCEDCIVTMGGGRAAHYMAEQSKEERKKRKGKKTTVKMVKKELQAVSKRLKALIKKMETVTKAVDKLEKAQLETKDKRGKKRKR